MCGIAGLYSLDGRSIDTHVLDEMVDSMARRGPDDRGTYRCPRFQMGMRRLSIIDVDGGHQPITNETGTVRVVQNGELYSYRELRRELIGHGHTFSTQSDTEVLVHGYEQWGMNGLLARLNGMFAFALHDASTDRFFLARDRLGVKPLFYAEAEGTLVFASTLTSIIQSGLVAVEPDPTGVRLFLRHQYVPGEQTAIAGVRRLLPGHVLEVSGSNLGIPRRYWSLSRSETNGRSFSDWLDELEVALDAAVLSHMVSDVDVGVFLSGGIDSTTILGLMARHTERPVSAFSIGFGELSAFDETPFARAAALRFGAELHHIDFSPMHVLDAAPDFFAQIDEPMGDSACIPTYLLAREARRHVKVVLSGEGADELFGGYEHYRHFGSRGRRLFERFKRLSGRRRLRCAKSGYPYVMSESAAAAITPDFGALDVTDSTHIYRLGDLPGHSGDDLNHALRVSIAAWLPDNLLMKLDRSTMAHSLEARVPFLDYRLVELAMSMPGDVKRHNGRDKGILREGARALIGDDIADRDKHGFSQPIDLWLRNELRPLAAASLETLKHDIPWLDETAVQGTMKSHFSGAGRGRELWMLIVLAEWYRGLRSRRFGAA